MFGNPQEMRALVAGLFVALTLPSFDAVCAEAASPHSLTGNLAFVSDYRFRGISQTFKLPALQGGLDYAHSGGFYVGTWLSNVSGNLYRNGAALEWDMYSGYKFELAKDLALDVGLLYYYYPGSHYDAAASSNKSTKFNNLEFYLGASYRWFSAKYSLASSDYFGINRDTYSGYQGISNAGSAEGAALPVRNANSRGSSYLDLNANFELAEKTTLGLHLGHTTVRNYGELSYSDYRLSLARELPWATLSLAYITTNAKQALYRYCETGNASSCKDPSRGTLVLSVAKSF